MHAYVLLKVQPQATRQLMQDLKAVAYIECASLVHGTYDCVVEVEAASLEIINEAVLQIRELAGIEDTTTCLVVHSFHREAQH